MSAEEVVERAARAAFQYDADNGHHRRPFSWDEIPEAGRDNYRELARAVLRAASGDPQ
jgi:hypothetical protein